MQQPQQQWSAPPPPAGGTNIPNNMVLAIIATAVSLIFCCIPHGLISLMFATQVNKKASAGDIPGAMAAAKNAKTWAMVSIIVAVITLILGIILNVAGMIALPR